MLYELILINEIEQRAKILFLSVHQKVVVSAAFGEFPLEVCFLSFFELAL